MKACIIQPPYSRDLSCSEDYFEFKLQMLDRCDDSMDIIVLPEYSEVPCATSTKEETLFYHEKYFSTLIEKCVETAKRCRSLVFVNALYEIDGNYRNTTYAFDRNGVLVGKYFKKHLPPSEQEILKLDSDYTFEFSEPYILEIEGLRYGFLTCYDFYFYEAFANIARQNADIIIGCSLQRTDSHDAIETMCRFLAYNTNTYVIRSSVSFSEDSDICGASMVVSPYGKVLKNMKGRFGMETVEFDPKDKYYKPAGFGSPVSAHYEYIEYGRKPWQYRPAGSAIVKPDPVMSYPRVCAHGGFNAVAPGNSLPAFGAAVALGAEEIEFDLWETADGQIVSVQDCKLDRVSNGRGYVYEKTYDELLKLDFGVKFGENFKNLKILKFEKILQKFSCHTIMNIHINTKNDIDPLSEICLKNIVALIDKYDCRKYVYFTTSNDAVLEQLQNIAPDICRCCGESDLHWTIVERAIKYGCKKVQLLKPYFNREMIDEAHKHGIKCNVFWSDDPEETIKFLDMGIDTIITNDYNLISQCVERREL